MNILHFLIDLISSFFCSDTGMAFLLTPICYGGFRFCHAPTDLDSYEWEYDTDAFELVTEDSPGGQTIVALFGMYPEFPKNCSFFLIKENHTLDEFIGSKLIMKKGTCESEYIVSQEDLPDTCSPVSISYRITKIFVPEENTDYLKLEIIINNIFYNINGINLKIIGNTILKGSNPPTTIWEDSIVQFVPLYFELPVYGNFVVNVELTVNGCVENFLITHPVPERLLPIINLQRTL